LNVSAPKDAFIAAVLVANRAHVDAGTEVLTLDPLDEDLRIARIGALDNLRVVLAKRLSTEVVDVSRQLQQAGVDSTAALTTKLAELINATNNAEHFGQEPPGTTEQIQMMMSQVSQQRDTGLLQLQLFDLQITEAKAINDLADRHLQKELAAAAARKARLHIVAPVSGRLSLQIATGRFVRHGDPLFEVS
jgi:multidrug resistance efflux pump